MRYLVSLSLIVLNICLAKANAIDRLRTNRDVEVFVNSIFKTPTEKSYPKAKVPSIKFIKENAICRAVLKQWRNRNWQKLDFNQDGKTDLLVIIYAGSQLHSFVIMDDGARGFKIHNLYRDGNFELATAANINSQKVVLYTFVKRDVIAKPYQSREYVYTDTLIYKSDAFVEFNPKPRQLSIKSIMVKTKGCYYSCPAFELSMQSTGKAVYTKFDDVPKERRFNGNIAAKKLKEIIDLISYINPQKLRNYYAVNRTDDETVNLTITFADGSSKTIKDYGMRGTFGLSRLYELLYDLRTSQPWK